MNPLHLFRSGLDYIAIASCLRTTEAEVEREIHRLRAEERKVSRPAPKPIDTAAKWQRTKAQLADIRRRHRA